MPDDGKGGASNADQGQDVELEVSNETENQEELYGPDGKPLPWNQSKRFRRIYGEAKEGRKLTKQLDELGLKPADLPKLRDALGRLSQYDAAYAEYVEAQKRGRTDAEDDQGADEVQKKIAAMKRQLKSLGVKFADEEDEAHDQKIAVAEQRRIVGQAQERISELLEDAGVDLGGMSREDRQDLIAEFDFKIGQRLARDEEGRIAFTQRGSMRPIERHFKAVLDKANLPAKKREGAPKGSGISNLPPRTSGSSPGSAFRQPKQQGPAKNVREATDDVLADLRARNAARRAEEG